ncbi:hypothetical protein [Natrinema sp. SYSU A 869]|uniref:hypothetical protein n=1 Tax=Natrinema sp. SYSU A 869 TaxID=2871694 RepID=UPI001CA41057|nr:hypothetical protein [Natrinema sp. SYSU A 869]
MADDDLKIIHENQDDIRHQLENPSLRRIATTDFEEDLVAVLSNYIDAPEYAAKKAIEEAKLWHQELNS